MQVTAVHYIPAKLTLFVCVTSAHPKTNILLHMHLPRLVLLSKISMQGFTPCCNQAKFTYGQTTKRNRDFSRN